MRSLATLAGLLLTLFATGARAAEGETALAFELGPERADGRAAGRVGATAWFGQTRWLWLEVGAGAQLTEDGDVGFEAVGGGVAALDVVRWVPWTELGVGAGRSGGRTGFLLRGGLGVDYLPGPNWAVGGAIRARGLIQDDPQALGSVELRIVRRFGF